MLLEFVLNFRVIRICFKFSCYLKVVSFWSHCLKDEGGERRETVGGETGGLNGERMYGGEMCGTVRPPSADCESSIILVIE